MASSRIIRDGILTSERVNQLDFEAEVFYRRLLSIGDDFGLFDARISILRPLLFPLKLDKMRETNIQRCLSDCSAAGLVRLYEVEGKKYGVILSYGQRIRKESKLRFPVTDEIAALFGDCPQFAAIGGGSPQSAANTKTNTYTKKETKTSTEDGALSRLINQSPLPKLPDEVEAYLSSLVGACRLMLSPADVSECSMQYFADRGSVGWVDRNGIPIADWKQNAWAYAMRWARNVAGKPSQGQLQNSNDDPFEEGKRL